MNEAERFLSRCLVHSDGLTSPKSDDPWRVGVVAYIECDAAIALIQKSDGGTNDYEFEGLWAMPGGMVRGSEEHRSEDVGGAATRSLAQRTLVELGISIQSIQSRGYSSTLGPIMSQYNRNGKFKQTLLVVRDFHMELQTELTPNDPTIRDAQWIFDLDWRSIAPANRVALSHLRWDYLDPTRKEAAGKPIQEALDICGNWARAVGLVSPPAPWDAAERLADWKGSFP